MQLMTYKLLSLFKQFKNKQRTWDPIVITRYYIPLTYYSWYATKYDEESETFYWYISSEQWERGEFKKKELEQLRFAWLCIERDKDWEPIPFSKIIKQ
jgi:hypothetical protein